MKNRKKFYFMVVLLLIFVHFTSFDILAQQDEEDVVIAKYRVLHSKILNEDRTLLVHLPRDYEGTKQHYPVVYLLYGDHITTYFAESVSVLDTLGPTGRIPDCILVGIMNTDRYRDLLPLAPDGKPTEIENFSRFLQEEVFTFIDTNYRTKNYRILVGPQAGANFGLYTIFEHPDLFNACIINHPFRWQGGREVILQKAEDCFKRNSVSNKFVFITYDDSDPLAKEGIGYIKKFSDMAEARSVEGFSLYLNFMPGHDEFLQRLGLRKGLKKLFEAYPFPYDRPVKKLDDILAFYRELSEKYGFEVDPPEHVVTSQGDRLMEQGKVKEVIDILKFTMDQYPNAANSYFRMANILLRRGELEAARGYLQKTMELIPFDNGMIRSRLERLEKRIAKSAAFQVEKEIRSSGIDGGIRKFRELKAMLQTPFYFDEGEFNELGYRLMQTGNLTGALEIFKLNAELYPGSANVYDSLGECYLKYGNQEKAVESYKKSLELNPGNNNARDKLKKIEKE